MPESDLKAIEAQCSETNGLAPVELSSAGVLSILAEVRRLQSTPRYDTEKVDALLDDCDSLINHYPRECDQVCLEEAVAAVRASREPAK